VIHHVRSVTAGGWWNYILSRVILLPVSRWKQGHLLCAANVNLPWAFWRHLSRFLYLWVDQLLYFPETTGEKWKSYDFQWNNKLYMEIIQDFFVIIIEHMAKHTSTFVYCEDILSYGFNYNVNIIIHKPTWTTLHSGSNRWSY